jgi:hypothetical protein
VYAFVFIFLATRNKQSAVEREFDDFDSSLMPQLSDKGIPLLWPTLDATYAVHCLFIISTI